MNQLLSVSAITDATDPDFSDVEALFEEAFPPSERKPLSFLREVARRSDYELLVGRSGETFVGFSIVYKSTLDFVLLEYMAVTDALRGQGLGGQLFLKTKSMFDRTMVLEVEAPQTGDRESIEWRRIEFYLRLECSIIEDLIYFMPQVSDEAPPPMWLLLAQSCANSISASTLRSWMNDWFEGVYECRDVDAIDEMFVNASGELKLSHGRDGESQTQQGVDRFEIDRIKNRLIWVAVANAAILIGSTFSIIMFERPGPLTLDRVIQICALGSTLIIGWTAVLPALHSFKLELENSTLANQRASEVNKRAAEANEAAVKAMKSTAYAALDEMYINILNIAIERPYLRQPKRLRGAQKAEYNIYAFMVWNFLETIHDRCVEEPELLGTWAPVIVAEFAVHKDWFFKETSPYRAEEAKFCIEFCDFVRQNFDYSGPGAIGSHNPDWDKIANWEYREPGKIKECPDAKKWIIRS